MKLLIFSPYYPPHIGGLQSHAEQFNQHMSKTGAYITVFTSQLPRSAPTSENKNRVTIIRFPAWEIIPNYPLPKFWQPAFWLEWQQLKKQRFDIVISRTRFFSTSLFALIYAKWDNIPWLHIEHGSDFVSLANPVTRLTAHIYDYTLGRLILHLADQVVANSKSSADFVKRLSGRTAAVIYRGVNQDAIINTAPDQNIKNIHKNKIIITFIGRLIDGKGVDDLLRALKIVSTPQTSPAISVLMEKHQGLRRRDFHCLIIGDGSKRESLNKLARQLGISKRITFLGQQGFSQSVSILKTSDIFINPSHTEGLPTSVIEAALCKTAIIATNVGGTPEIVTNNTSAYLVQPKHPSILADRLIDLIQNPAKRQLLSEHAYREVINKFSWPASTAAYNKILKHLIQTPGV
ncbi:MAG: glycosyltransferase family 4 protein [bacterium]